MKPVDKREESTKSSRDPTRNNSDEIILEDVELKVHEISIVLRSQIPTESGKE